MQVATIASLMMNLEKEVFLLKAMRHAINDARFKRLVIFSKIGIMVLRYWGIEVLGIRY
jgi:hypothetical protein